MILLRLLLIVFSIIGFVLSLNLAYFNVGNSSLSLFEKTNGILNSLPFFVLGLWLANEIKPLAILSASIFAKVLISISLLYFVSYCIQVAKNKDVFLSSLTGFLGQASFTIVITLILLSVGLRMGREQRK